jgi:hypothetical protein
MRFERTVFLGAAALVLVGWAGARRAGAQTLEAPRSRQGYYLALGGYGLANQNWDGEGAALGLAGGGGTTLRMGQLLTRRLGLGLGFDLGGSRRGGRRAQLGGVALEGQWELARHLALRGGVGLSVVILKDDDDPEAGSSGGVGSGYFLGLGYDWFPFQSRRRSGSTGGFALTPVVQVRFTPAAGTRALVGTAGLELTYWTGLPRNQLELDEADAYQRR